MKDTSKYKEKITELVTTYTEVYRTEYNAFLEGFKITQDKQLGDYSEVKNSDLIERAVAEWPETLDVIFGNRLTPEEDKYLRSKEGIRWFIKTFKQFRISKKV